MEEQKNLKEDIKKRFKVRMIEVANKTDMGTAKIDAMMISAKENLGITELKNEILSAKDNWTAEEQSQ